MAAQDDEFDEMDEPRTPGVRQRMKALEEENRALRERADRADAAERRLAFIEAGVDVTDPKSTYFMKGYDGEVDVDAIRAAAHEAGFISPPAASSTPPAEQEAWKRISQASSGATGVGAEPIDWNARIAATKNDAELDAVMAEYRAAQG